jgi:hypothetical protein
LTGVVAVASVGNVGVVSDGLDPETGDRIINVNAGDGTRSTSRLKEDGSVSLHVAEAASVGRRNEPRVIRTLRQRLQTEHTVSFSPGRDDWGEDSLLIIDGQDYVLQIVTAPGETDFWRQAKVRVERPDMAEAAAVTLLRIAIEKKANKITPQDRPRTLLALDAQHAGVLASDRVIAATEVLQESQSRIRI